MPETLGSLTDKLSILNIKIWMVQDWVYAVSKETPEAFANRSPEETHRKIQQLAELNLDRNRTMTAIDELLARAVETGRAPSESRVKIT